MNSFKNSFIHSRATIITGHHWSPLVINQSQVSKTIHPNAHTKNEMSDSLANNLGEVPVRKSKAESTSSVPTEDELVVNAINAPKTTIKTTTKLLKTNNLTQYLNRTYLTWYH